MLDLSSRAVLVSCEVNMFRTNRVDKDVTSKINQEYQTKRKAGSFTKQIMSKDYTRGYESAAAEIKRYYKLMTLPWDPVNRILAIELHQEFMDGTRQRISTFEDYYDQFCINFSQYVHSEKELLGPGLWRAEDYPSMTQVRDLGGVKLNIIPIPSVGDWRVKLSQDELDYLNENLKKQITARFTSAMTSAWKKLYDPVKAMADRLAESKKPHNSIVQNIKDILPVLLKLNIGKDPKLDEMVKEIEQKLCGFTGKEIRNDKEVRNTLKDATAEIMKKMAPYAGVAV